MVHAFKEIIFSFHSFAFWRLMRANWAACRPRKMSFAYLPFLWSVNKNEILSASARSSIHHRAENTEQAQRCLSWCHWKWSSAVLRSPHLAEAVSLAAFFAICPCFSLTADGTQKKQRPTGYVFQCKHSKWGKTKEKELTFSRKVMMCHHYVCWPLSLLKVLLKINLSFVSLSALCSAAIFMIDWNLIKIWARLQNMAANGVTSPQLSWILVLALYLQLCANRTCKKAK